MIKAKWILLLILFLIQQYQKHIQTLVQGADILFLKAIPSFHLKKAMNDQFIKLDNIDLRHNFPKPELLGKWCYKDYSEN